MVRTRFPILFDVTVWVCYGYVVGHGPGFLGRWEPGS